MTTVKEAMMRLTSMPADKNIVVQIITFDDLEWNKYDMKKQDIFKNWEQWSTDFQIRTKWPLIREIQEWADIYVDIEEEMQHRLVEEALKKMGVE